jgi:NADH-quinone oxidoreductase subunit D
MHTWHDRESILDVMEELSGGRVAHAVNQIGGVRFDLDEDHGPMVDSAVEKLRGDYEELLDVIEHDTTLKARTEGIAPLSADDMKRHCVVGPVARASGVDVDMRRDDPMPPYDKLDFQVITHSDGDAWSRTYVRLQEIRQSLHLCKQIIDDIPEGPISVRAPRKVPAGEVVMRSEAPRGELFYYLRSDGSEYPARLKIRTPTLPALGILPKQLSEIHIADIPVVLAGIDLCIACADR